MMLSPSSHGRMSGSPTRATAGGTKRKRKALSCFDCRRRKLKCDREYPTCSRCQKAGQADTCSYDERALASRHVSSNTSSLKHSTSTPQAPTEWCPPLRVRQTNGSGHSPPTVEANQTSGTWQLRGELSPLVSPSAT